MKAGAPHNVIDAISEPVMQFTIEAESLGLDIESADVEAMASFNVRIQSAIESAEAGVREKSVEAVRLAQIKFLANQKFDRLRRETQA